MPAAGLEQVAEKREGRIDGVEQPETGDVGRREIGEALIFLAAQAGDGSGAGGQNLHQLTGDACEVIAGMEIEQGRNESRFGLKGAGLGAPYSRHAQVGEAVEGFAFGEQTQVLVGDLYRLFGEAGVFVAEQFDFRAVARATLTAGSSDVETALAVLRNRQVNVEGGLIRL